MQYIKIKDVVVEDRQRSHMDDDAISALAASIQTKGLMHPIVLRFNHKTLVAGERRLKALKSLFSLKTPLVCNGNPIPLDSVPYITLADLTEEALVEAELEENLRRVNLSPQEEALAIAKLHNLRIKENPEHTIAATTCELIDMGAKPSPVPRDLDYNHNVSGAVKAALDIAEYMHIPQVAKAKTKKEALKLISKLRAAAYREKLAQDFKGQEDTFKIIKADCLEYIKSEQVESESLDVICVDPPYGIDATSFGTQSLARHKYNDSPAECLQNLESFIINSYKLLKPKAHLYMFCDFIHFNRLSHILTCNGFTVWPRPLIWVKSKGMLAKPEHGPRYTYECIIFANKGMKKVKQISNDTIIVPNVANLEHGAEKPIELYINLLQRSIDPGDMIADFFAGSGPIIGAAKALKCRCLAVEKDSEYFGLMVERYKGIGNG